MHLQAYRYVQSQVNNTWFPHVVEFGSRDINGSVKKLFNYNTYWGIDLYDGPLVDEVADVVTWDTVHPPSAIVCCEVLEHAPNVEGIIESAYRNLIPNGLFIVTCATDPRAPHSAIDGGHPRKDEYYGNVDPEQFREWCADRFLIDNMEVIKKRGDLYATCRRITY